MKKLLLSSIVLLIFSIAILLFQLSCKKDSFAQSSTDSLSQLNKIIYVYRPSHTESEVWTANYDGSGKTKINITMPGSTYQVWTTPKLSPNGKIIFLDLIDRSVDKVHIYSCNLDGSNMTKLVDGSTAVILGVSLGGAY